jgi:hypothetical protein
LVYKYNYYVNYSARATNSSYPLRRGDNMSYDAYMAGIKKYVEDNKPLIDQVNKEAKEIIFPQHILWYKNVYKELVDELNNAKTTTIDGEFYFTEKLVNKLMLFAWHKGQHNIEEMSYKRGWNDRMKDIANLLGLEYEE